MLDLKQINKLKSILIAKHYGAEDLEDMYPPFTRPDLPHAIQFQLEDSTQSIWTILLELVVHVSTNYFDLRKGKLKINILQVGKHVKTIRFIFLIFKRIYKLLINESNEISS